MRHLSITFNFNTSFQLLRNHIVDGIVGSSDLDDDMVGPSIAGTKLRSNVYRTENGDWKEIEVSCCGKYIVLMWYCINSRILQSLLT